MSQWGFAYPWVEQGDEWSRAWGGPQAHWFGSILPRIHPFLPTDTILEIGPGFGRWTYFLKEYCKRLVVVDLNGTCLESCKKRFGTQSNITYYQNDGMSLDMLAD